MAVERTSGAASLIDVLDRVLDKGIVVDAGLRAALVTADAPAVVVASIEIHLTQVAAVALPGGPDET